MTTALVVTAGTLQAGDLPRELHTVEVSGTWGVVAANTREAAEAGARVLEEGGNAVDAAVATALTLGVSEAEASGIGGNAWMLIHLADGRDVAIDGSAAVPVLTRPNELRSLLDDGVDYGYKTVAAPGGLAALADALARYGTKSFATVVAPAVTVAEQGIRLTPHQWSIVGAFGWKLAGSPALGGVFLNASLSPWPPNHVYCLDHLATTLQRLAGLGARDFYAGGIADEIEADMKANGGFLRKLDLVQIRPVQRTPLRGRYRDCEVVSFPFPGGGAALIEALQILDRFPRELLARDTPDRSMLLVEAVRISLYDLFAACEGGAGEELQMVLPQRAAHRAAQITLKHALSPRDILDREVTPWRQEGSTHLSVIDREGNVVAASLTFNEEFGACVSTPALGFPYNATLAMYNPTRPDSPLFPRPGNVLPHTMTPTLVFRDGKPLLVLGGPGSARITSTLVDVISNVIDRRMSLGEAVAAPRVLWDGGPNPKVYLEIAGPHTDAEVAQLHRRGFPDIYSLRFPPRPIDLLAFGGVNVIGVDLTTGRSVGAGDPRRAGVAVAADVP
jgi:gamma-glutamyltranspeptidase/glutathione hydrolase